MTEDKVESKFGSRLSDRGAALEAIKRAQEKGNWPSGIEKQFPTPESRAKFMASIRRGRETITPQQKAELTEWAKKFNTNPMATAGESDTEAKTSVSPFVETPQKVTPEVPDTHGHMGSEEGVKRFKEILKGTTSEEPKESRARNKVPPESSFPPPSQVPSEKGRYEGAAPISPKPAQEFVDEQALRESLKNQTPEPPKRNFFQKIFGGIFGRR